MHLHFRWAYELVTHPRILDAVEDILGPDVLIWATELFAKSPRTPNVAVGWHRDRPYLGFVGGQSVTAWLALSPSTAGNGCMRALPRRFDEGKVEELPRGHAVQGGEPDSQQIVDLTLHPGEMSVHDADVLHGSRANNSDEKRVGFVIRFVTPDAQPIHGKPPTVLACGRD